jgi:hypothetical protein
MQRIDEKTFIDNTLITCVEYQLFMGEMLEHGQSYRPVQWTSYQFPSGQGHAPVLGINSFAAQAFCEWLTRRESEEWLFRIPTIDEATSFPIKQPDYRMIGRSIVSYWAIHDSKSQFALIEVNSSRVHFVESNLELISENNLAEGIRIVKERPF